MREYTKGWKLNPDKAVTKGIGRMLKMNGGFCPCIPVEQHNDDTKCNCKEFREGKGCHCQLFIKD